ncbi:MAG: hypothetical protein OK439_05785 [Thaumarchaeota archaeon]|nr:hypothetical protein [Nitrososphaerota archaeon]
MASRIEDLESRITSSGESLVVTDLTTLKLDEIRRIVELSTGGHSKILGFYPHVSKQIGVTAMNAGVDYITPRSGFRSKLNSLLS